MHKTDKACRTCGPSAIALLTALMAMAAFVEGLFASRMRVCAMHNTDRYTTSSCNYDYRYYSLPPGGNVTVHFNQLVVADTIRIIKSGFLTLCEVDVLGTKVVLDPEG